MEVQASGARSERQRLALRIQDWAEHPAVGERYHISNFLAYHHKKLWFVDHGVPPTAELPSFALMAFVALHNRLW
jgi:hypothetical protein